MTPLLAPEELASLSVSLGSLTPEERVEIESHVSQTYRFLAKIPWTRDLSRVAQWAYGHHEKLNGSGYPRRLTAEAIPPPVRMLTICDIFDALAARDRPYKSAVPAERVKNKLPHDVPMSPMAQEILSGIPRIGERYVFTTIGNVPVSNYGEYKACARPSRKAGLTSRSRIGAYMICGAPAPPAWVRSAFSHTSSRRS